MSFLGYRRPDGSVGVRNHVAIISTVTCANEVVSRIANQVKGTVPVTHNMGCGHYAFTPLRPLAGLGKNPNVAAVLVVGLGCEVVSAKILVEEIEKSNKPVASIVIQDLGGTIKATKQGVEIVKSMARRVSRLKREPFDLSNLTLGLECGGSDATSGIVANPAVGRVADMVVKAGGKAILAETVELIGAEHVLARRAVNEKVAEEIVEVIRRMEERMIKSLNLPVDLITPGNIEGGLSTLEEKSLGDSYKAGSFPIQGMLEYAETPTKKGLFIMDEPGYDPESVTGIVAAGAQIVVFTTGRGTPLGSAVAPVIKITGNPRTYKTMNDNIDINAGTVIEGKETIEEVSRRIFEKVLKVASGEKTKAEVLGHTELALHWSWPIPEKLEERISIR